MLVASGFVLVAGWLVLVAGALAMFVALEQLAPRRAAPIRWRAIAIASGLLLVDATIARAMPMPAASSAARAALALVLVEIADYAIHRAMHAVPLLWRFHRLHHEERLAWHVGWRIHPVDVALFGAGAAAACWIASASLPTGAAVIIARRLWTLLLHANIRWPASPLDAVIATPAFHRVHHEGRANFASTLPLIDRLLGTYRGSRTTNVAPCPGVLATSIAPPCASTSLRTT